MADAARALSRVSKETIGNSDHDGKKETRGAATV
jgi:hypothetical protein